MATKGSATPWDADGPGPTYRFGSASSVTGWSRLWSIGDRAILNRQLLGFFSSRRCPGDVIIRTFDLARNLRDNELPVIGGFHSPMEQECLKLLLRGTQPVVVCPARSIEKMRVPTAWKNSIKSGRLLILSPFPAKQSRMTSDLAAKRNRIVADLAAAVFIAHATADSQMARFSREILALGKPVWTFECPANASLRAIGVQALSGVPEIREILSSDRTGAASKTSSRVATE